MAKYLYSGREARAAIGCGVTKFYQLINTGALDARRFGKRTYITTESLRAFVDSLKPVVTPTMEKAENEKWAGLRWPQPNPQEDEPGAAE
jgi:hypothetical protein